MTKKETQFNRTVSGVLDGGVTNDIYYLQITVPSSQTFRQIDAIYASYLPDTGGFTTASDLARVGRLLCVVGDLTLDDGIQLDPFSPNIVPNNVERILVNQVVRGELALRFPRPIEITSSPISVAIGKSVGEGDSASSPSSSIGYLTLVGREFSEQQLKSLPFVLR